MTVCGYQHNLKGELRPVPRGSIIREQCDLSDFKLNRMMVFRHFKTTDQADCLAISAPGLLVFQDDYRDEHQQT
jgi:hypothetical protein